MATPETYFYVLVTVLLGVVAYFLKQLVGDFKRVEKEVTNLHATMGLAQAEFKGINELMNQRMAFLERRIQHLENNTLKGNGHEYK